CACAVAGLHVGPGSAWWSSPLGVASFFPPAGSAFFFFFSSRRRHTRFSRDWSSDVCSSRSLYVICEQDLYPCDPSLPLPNAIARSEERRVGKECRSRWSRTHQKKKKTDKEAGSGRRPTERVRVQRQPRHEANRGTSQRRANA